MGGLAIIGLGKGFDRNPAPVSDYTALYSALGGNHGQQSLTDRFMVINAAGEAVGYSDQMGIQYTPETVAGHIKRGGIFIDYCGFPFFYQAEANGTIQTLGQTGWHQFAAFLGYGWLANVSFIPPFSVTVSLSGSPYYKFVRGFPLSQSLVGVCYDNGTFTIPGGLLGIGGSTGHLTANGWTAMIALHPPGGGYYFYAVYTPESEAIRGGLTQVRGVPISLYAAFIQDVIQGRTGGYVCRPYQIAVQSSRRIAPGPTSPVTTHTVRQTPATAKTATHATTSPATTHLVEDILIGGTAVAGLGLIAAAVARHQGRR